MQVVSKQHCIFNKDLYSLQVSCINDAHYFLRNISWHNNNNKSVSITVQRNTLQTSLCHNQNVSPYADLSMSDKLSVNTSY